MNRGFMSSLGGIIIIALFSVLLFYVLKGFWAFATFFAWIFLAIAAIANHKVILNYAKGIFDLIGRNPLYGIGAIVFSVLLYPLVFFILMMRALGGRAIKTVGFDIPRGAEQQEREEYVDYEIIDEELELKELELKNRENR